MPARANLQVPYVLWFRDFLYRSLSSSIPEGPFVVRERDTQRALKFNLTGKIGSGLTGSVHRIDPRSTGLTELGLEQAAYIAKIPHAVRGTSGHVIQPFCNLAMELEKSSLEIIVAQIDAVENSNDRPTDPYWLPGRLPFAEISRLLHTDRGTILIKPEVIGLSIGEIRRANPRDLSAAMLDALKEIYQLAQTMSLSVRMPGAHAMLPQILNPSGTDRPFYLDINGTNLIWVEDPKYFNAFGLRKAGFVFCELAEIPSPRYLKTRFSFENYLEEFLIAADFEARNSHS